MASEMSLEDIIKKNKVGVSRGGGRPAGRRGGRGFSRGGRGGSAAGGGGGGGAPRRNINSQWNHDMYRGGPRGASTQSSSGKLFIANLDFGVSDADIRELFSEFGPMRTAAVHYDRSGRSQGTANVTFERSGDASRAVKQYNGVHLDGRPMTITMDGGAPGRDFRPPGGRTRGTVKRLSNGVSRGGSRGSGRGRGRGARAPRTTEKPKSAEDLDKELDAYISEAKSKPAEETAA